MMAFISILFSLSSIIDLLSALAIDNEDNRIGG
jgi:hypothetical protein